MGLFQIQSLVQGVFPMGPNSGQSIHMRPLYGLLWVAFSSPRRVRSSQISGGRCACITAQKFPKASGYIFSRLDYL